MYKSVAVCAIAAVATALVSTEVRSIVLPSPIRLGPITAATPSGQPIAGTNPISVHIDMKIAGVPTDIWDKIPASDKASESQLLSIIQQNKGCIIESPSMTTTSNVPAGLSIQTKVPYGSNIATATEAPRYNSLDIGTVTKVTPRINSDSSIAIQLSFKDTELSKSVQISAAPLAVPPATYTFSVDNQYVVKNAVPSAFKLGTFVSSDGTLPDNKVYLIEITATSKYTIN